MIGKGAIRAAGRRRLSGANYIAEAVVFDGTNDYLLTTSLSPTSSTLCTLSAWCYHVDITDNPHIFGGGGTLFIRVLAGGNFQVVARTSGGANVFAVSSTNTISTNAWHHILVSWDATTGDILLYIDDVDVTGTVNYNTGTVSFGPNFSVGSNAGTQLLYGDLSEAYFTNEYLDLSIEANRRKFITAVGTPVDLGADGSLPTGTQPLIYFKGVASVWNAGTNAGSGGSFTMTGSVADSSNEPVELP